MVYANLIYFHYSCMCVCVQMKLTLCKSFYPLTAPGHYLCQTRPIVDSILIKLLRPEQNDRQFVNGGINFVFSIETSEFKTTRHHDVFPRVLMTKVSIGWVKGLVPNRRQAITWTRANQDTWGHCSVMAPYGVTDFGQHWFKYWYDTMLAPGHYLNQSYLTVNRTLINSLTPEQNGRHFAGGISNAFL